MKGCLKLLGYGVVAIVVLVVIAVIFGGNSDRPGRSTRQTASQSSAQQSVASTEAPTIAPTSAMTFTAANWVILASDPDAYEDAQVDIIGKIFREPERTTEFTGFQMWASPRESEWNTLVRSDDPNLPVDDGDYVHVRGRVRGSFEGQNLMGGTVRATVIMADSVEVVDALAAAAPALRVAELNQGIDQHGLVVRLIRVEFAEDETRVHVSVKNNTTTEASFYSSSAKAVQGSAQFDYEYSFDGYPEVQSALLPGVESTGVIVLPAMNPGAQTTIYLSGRTDDYSLNFEDYVFMVAAQ